MYAHYIIRIVLHGSHVDFHEEFSVNQDDPLFVKNDMFKHFGYNNCQRDRSVIFRYKSVFFLENWHHICMFPIKGNFSG